MSPKALTNKQWIKIVIDCTNIFSLEHVFKKYKDDNTIRSKAQTS